jgi:hypothetical protein
MLRVDQSVSHVKPKTRRWALIVTMVASAFHVKYRIDATEFIGVTVQSGSKKYFI